MIIKKIQHAMQCKKKKERNCVNSQEWFIMAGRRIKNKLRKREEGESQEKNRGGRTPERMATASTFHPGAATKTSSSAVERSREKGGG